MKQTNLTNKQIPPLSRPDGAAGFPGDGTGEPPRTEPALKELSGDEIFQNLNEGKLSVLEAFGANGMKEEMVPAGKFCIALAKAVCADKKDEHLRSRAIRLVRLCSPTRLYASFPPYDGPVVIGFNHPSLGEIFRLLYLGLRAYPDKKFLFPVNLPWYEAIVPIIPELSRLGITITPLITPSCEQKLMQLCGGDSQKIEDLSRIKSVFEWKYLRRVKEIGKENGVIVIAPSATRQSEIVGKKTHPVMALLSTILLKAPDVRAMFLPVAVIEPKRNDRRMNPGKFYGIHPCAPFYAEDIRSFGRNDRNFDDLFLKRIEEVYHTHRDTPADIFSPEVSPFFYP